jgi:phosphomannomutase
LHFEEGVRGVEKREKLMRELRGGSLGELDGSRVLYRDDFLCGIREHFPSGKREKMALPLSDMLLWRLEDGSKIIVRPSGTEPSMRIHVAVSVQDFASIDAGICAGDQHVERLLKLLKDRFLKF